MTVLSCNGWSGSAAERLAIRGVIATVRRMFLPTLKPQSILGLGTIVLDQVSILSEYPREDTKTDCLETRLQVGGPVPTALALLRKWGINCALISAWGDDPAGNLIEGHLRAKRIDHSQSIGIPGAMSASAHVWLSRRNGTRTTACHRMPTPPALAKIPLDYFLQFTALHLDGWPQAAALRAAQTMRESGGTVILDSGSPKPGVQELLPYVTHLHCPRHFIEQFMGEADIRVGMRRLLETGPQSISVTLGQEGAMFATAESWYSIPAHTVDVVDSNGAGDVFCGAMIFGLLNGLEHHDCLRLANAAAALKCGKIGNDQAQPTLAQAMERASGPKDHRLALNQAAMPQNRT